jgi:hypothetical protein
MSNEKTIDKELARLQVATGAFAEAVKEAVANHIKSYNIIPTIVEHIN